MWSLCDAVPCSFQHCQACNKMCSRLEVVPGFQTSILNYENDTLLQLDVSHCIFRTDTVLDMLYLMQQSQSRSDLERRCKTEIVGKTVFTGYRLELMFSVCTVFDDSASFCCICLWHIRHANIQGVLDKFDSFMRENKKCLVTTTFNS